MNIEYESLFKFNQPFFDQFKKSFEDTLHSGWYILGKNVKKFEQEFAVYLGTKYCVGVASGLDALEISLAVLELPKNSEVLVPSNTYIATILSIVKLGLKPILVEPDPQTYNINPEEIEKHITLKTRAIMPVHMYGKPCEMDKIMQIANAHSLYVIEDCAQSHGAKFKGQKTGTFGDFGAFSFYPTKNLGALGDGGCIVCSNEKLYDKIVAFRNYGSQKKYFNKYVGYNSRLDEVQAGFLSLKLKKLDEINEHKRKLAKLYDDLLVDEFVKPQTHSDYYDIYHIYPIRHTQRDELKEYLLNQGIKTEIHYPLAPHKQEAMMGILEGSYPISEDIHNTILSLPVSYSHTEEEILYVIEHMNAFVNQTKKVDILINSKSD